jgi:hypothetical protein
VILSWGEHAGGLLGTVSGSALTELHFAARAGGVEQRLSAYVRIDDEMTARLARLLVPLFGFIADRKLAEGLVLCAQTATWAAAHPEELRAWLEAQPVTRERRDAMLRHLREPARAGITRASYGNGNSACTIGRSAASSVHAAVGLTRQTSPDSVPTSTPLTISGSGVTAWKLTGEGACALSPSDRHAPPVSSH